MYPPLTVRVSGYDFRVLEKYQSFVHKIANLLDFDVEEWYDFS